MDLAETLAAVGTVALSKNGARPLGSHLFPLCAGKAFAATATPVRCLAGDNLALHVAVAQAGEDCALVVDATAAPDFGYVDEVLAVAAQLRGVAGIVLDGCVRDIAGIARCGLPVVSQGVSVREPTAERGGSVGEPVTFGEPGAGPVRRGDWVVADDDGVVVLPRGRAADIMAVAFAGVRRERAVLQQLSEGRSTLDVFNLDPSRVRGWRGAPVPSRAAGDG